MGGNYFCMGGQLVQTQFPQDHSLNESEDQNDSLNDSLVILNQFFPKTLAAETVSQIVSSTDEGCKKELALAIIFNKPSAARKMQFQEAPNKAQIGFAKWTVSTQTTCIMQIISKESFLISL